MRHMEKLLMCVFTAFVLWPAVARGAAVQISQEYGELIKGRGITALKDDLFGDRVSLYTGVLEFLQTDVSLPGNNELPVMVSRYFSPRAGGRTSSHFGDWDLDIPRLHGVFPMPRDGRYLSM
jgi:hypothetical protein